MRLTCAFISTLLFASTVLASAQSKETSRFAGYRVQKPIDTFMQVLAEFALPKIRCETGSPTSSVYVGVTIGDKDCGAEASILISCNNPAFMVYSAYAQMFPGGPPNHYPLNLYEGDSVKLGVLGDAVEGVRVFISNTHEDRTGTTGFQKLGPFESLTGCRDLASWGMRADVDRRNGRLKDTPKFQPDPNPHFFLRVCHAWSFSNDKLFPNEPESKAWTMRDLGGLRRFDPGPIPTATPAIIPIYFFEDY